MDIDPHVVAKITSGTVGSIGAMFLMRDTWVRRISVVLPAVGLSYYAAAPLAVWAHMPEGLSGCLVGMLGMAFLAKIINTLDRIDAYAILKHRFPRWFP